MEMTEEITSRLHHFFNTEGNVRVEKQLFQIKSELMSTDSMIVKVHPDGTSARKKNGPQAIGKSRGGWITKIHLIAEKNRSST